MGDALLDHAFLEGPVAVVPPDVVGSLGMELDAPAPTEDAVVSLHQCREEVPRVRGQWLDRRGARALGCHDADRTPACARPERVPRTIPQAGQLRDIAARCERRQLAFLLGNGPAHATQTTGAFEPKMAHRAEALHHYMVYPTNAAVPGVCGEIGVARSVQKSTAAPMGRKAWAD